MQIEFWTNIILNLEGYIFAYNRNISIVKRILGMIVWIYDCIINFARFTLLDLWHSALVLFDNYNM